MWTRIIISCGPFMTCNWDLYLLMDVSFNESKHKFEDKKQYMRLLKMSRSDIRVKRRWSGKKEGDGEEKRGRRRPLWHVCWGLGYVCIDPRGELDTNWLTGQLCADIENNYGTCQRQEADHKLPPPPRSWVYPLLSARRGRTSNQRIPMLSISNPILPPHRLPLLILLLKYSASWWNQGDGINRLSQLPRWLESPATNNRFKIYIH